MPHDRQKRKSFRLILGLLPVIVAICLFVLLPYLFPHATQSSDAALQIHIIDVGQGDATLLLCEAGTVLIDAGTNAGEDALRAYLDSCGVEQIDYLIISHPHEDHMGGADMVLREYEVKTLVLSDLAPDADIGMSWTVAWLSGHTRVAVPKVGDQFAVGDLCITVLAPPKGGFEQVNNNSLVLRCEYGETSMLTTGDAESEAEDWLLSHCDTELLDVDLLKAGHHGSDTSTGRLFLEAVTPNYVAISCGRGNSYNHPVQSVLDLISSVHAEICRTDQEGSLVFLSDGRHLWRKK